MGRQEGFRRKNADSLFCRKLVIRRVEVHVSEVCVQCRRHCHVILLHRLGDPNLEHVQNRTVQHRMQPLARGRYLC